MSTVLHHQTLNILRGLFLAMQFTFCLSPAGAQESVAGTTAVFKHVGADLSVGTEGIGINIATPVTSYLELSLGVDYMPGFKISGDVDVDDIHYNYTDPATGINVPQTIAMNEVNISGKLSRTTYSFKANVYPFGARSDWFLAAGFSFGGKKIAKLSGHSDDVQQFMKRTDVPDAAKERVFAEIDKYQVDFDRNGDICGDIRVKGFRPYIGLGWGRLVPKSHRLGFRVELGCQFMGKMKIYQNDKEVDINDLGEKGDDNLSNFIDKIKVYPVLRCSLTGRIL